MRYMSRVKRFQLKQKPSSSIVTLTNNLNSYPADNETPGHDTYLIPFSSKTSTWPRGPRLSLHKNKSNMMNVGKCTVVTTPP